MNSMLQALGLHRHPFPPTPDAESYFYTPQLESDLAEIRHCILARKGFVLVAGEVGLGKSTLVRRLLASLQDQPVRSALVLNTFLQDEALLDAILADFGLPTGVGMAAGLTTLNQFLLDGHRQGITSLLVIDDAQNSRAASFTKPACASYNHPSFPVTSIFGSTRPGRTDALPSRLQRRPCSTATREAMYDGCTCCWIAACMA